MALKLASDSEDLAVAHEINVTPFIDVMLVLLIIFMVAAPLATVAVKVALPVSNAQAAAKPETPVYLSLQADGGHPGKRGRGRARRARYGDRTRDCRRP